MYCYSRGHAQSSASEQTIALVSAILAEVEQGPVLPTLIAGDLNCEVEDAPMLRARALIQDQVWLDIGACEAYTHSAQPLASCLAHG
eukprot:5716678-Alexandrium_andersonii.AAC.1